MRPYPFAVANWRGANPAVTIAHALGRRIAAAMSFAGSRSGGLAALAVLCSVQTVGAAPVGIARVTVRISDQAAVREGSLKLARETATSIFRQAGVQITWRICRTVSGPGSGAPDPCDDVLGPSELIVRMVDDQPATGDQAPPLGSSYVDTNVGGGSLATVFTDRVTMFAAQAGVPAGLVLGRALAHEIGHLLLGTRHASHGLMRASWEPRQASTRFPRDWNFSRDEAGRLCQALFVRACQSMGSAEFDGARCQGVVLSAAQRDLR